MLRLSLLAVCAVAAALPATAAEKGDAARGKAVFQQCSVCHAAESTQKKMGPGLKSVFKREKLADGKKVTEAAIRTKIDEGGAGMPGYKNMLSAAQKDDLIAYLKTL